MNMRVEASVDHGVLNWRYVANGDEWKQSMPLAKMVPHPMFSIDRGTRWKYLAMTVLLPLLAFGVVSWLEFGLTYTISIPVVSFLVLAYRFSPWLIGPIEWATFDTMLKDKTVYVFRGAQQSGFDEFVAALDNAIDAASTIPEEVGEP
ncbi:hypothetical protein [Crateriforma conspicua]|uniref:hypothetical protein n=1 Tax=Crateriforma conspicua TaxID=2527996 RepID=UPI00118C43B8|nr:hypothetical protein [Crateriforma conspicua]QDV61073.1 hypothetical protein Mal65_01960 [Crateriforma conspicua]QDV61095.1 hypothetical protein Mal65_02180 [Crateriforma conspicua]